jgi:hypothetical protein
MLYDDYDNLIWHTPDIQIPTKEQIKSELDRMNAVSLSMAYQSSRISEYPSITEQLDLLYHHGYDGWKDVIKKVKDKYPKSE